MLSVQINKILGPSWRTSITGYVIAAANVAIPLLQDGHATWRQVAASVAIALVGRLVKDTNVTGGTTLAPNAIPDAALHAQALRDEKEPLAGPSPKFKQ